MGEIIFLGVIAVISLIMFLMTFSFPTSIIDKSGGPGLFPRIVIILFLFFAMIRLVEIIRKKEIKKPFAFLEMFQGSRAIYLLSTLIYMLIISHLGYIISSAAYILFSIFYYYRREMNSSLNRKQIILISMVNSALVVFIYFSFTSVLNILLPKGILGG
jgi:hypothetical protein